jgi:hypothetical protein
MDKTLTWYGYLLGDGLLRVERLLSGDEPRDDAIRVYGPISAKSRLLAYRDLRVMHAAADPLIRVDDVELGTLADEVTLVVSQYARIVGRVESCELLARLLVQLSDGGSYDVEGGDVVVSLGKSVVSEPVELV